MKMLKKLGLSLLGLAIIFGINFSYAQISNGQAVQTQIDTNSNPYVGEVNVGDNSISQGSNIFSEKLIGIIHIPQSDDYNTSFGYAMALIQTTINRLLGILAFVALVYMLYSGFLVFTSGSDDKNASKGKKGISTAAIALAGIGLSWLIISAIIWLINNVAAN